MNKRKRRRRRMCVDKKGFIKGLLFHSLPKEKKEKEGKRSCLAFLPFQKVQLGIYWLLTFEHEGLF